MQSAPTTMEVIHVPAMMDIQEMAQPVVLVAQVSIQISSHLPATNLSMPFNSEA